MTTPGLVSPGKKVAGPGKFLKFCYTQVKNMNCMAASKEN